jgi:phospholipase/lecithinase/hemolysin
LGAIYSNLPLEQIGVSDAVAAQSILTPAETGQVVSAVEGYNNFIQDQADNRGWAYVDVNNALGALYAAGTDTPQDPSDDLVPKFPQLNSVTEADVSTFGRFFSEDGVHPTGATHQVVTNLFIAAINQEYGTSLEPIEAPDVPTP